MRKTFTTLLIYTFLLNLNAQETFSSLVSKVEKTVVSIKTYDDKDNILKIGSGFFIDSKGTLVSNYHVFDKCISAKITTSNNNEFVVDRILLSSKNDDIIKFSISNPENVVFDFIKTTTTKPLKGDDIFVIGNPEGLHNSVSKGIISSVRNLQSYGDIYQITAPISPGSSGSPVFNMTGEVLGIASFQIIEGQNLNFAIDISKLNNIQSNDMILSTLKIKKELPKDRNLALNTISMISNDTSITLYHRIKEQLYYYNEFIKNYPMDYIGYHKRGNLKFAANYFGFVNDSSDNYSYDRDKSLKRRSILFSEIINDFTTALNLKGNDSKILYDRASAKMFYLKENNPNKLQNCTYEIVLNELSSCIFKENSFLNFLKLSSLASCYNQLNSHNSAILYYSKALDLLERLPNDEIKKFICEDENYKTTLDELELLKNRHIENTLFERGLIKLIANNDTVGSLSDINRSIELNERFRKNGDYINYEHYRKRADLRYAKNDLTGALLDYRIVNSEDNRKISADSKNCYSMLIESFLIQNLNGDLNDALKASINSINYLFGEYEKSDSYYFYNRANIYYKLEYYHNALIDINKAIELDSSNQNSDYLYLRINIKSQLNDHIGALTDINKTIPLNNNDDYAHYKKGMILWKLNDNMGAEKSFTKAIELSPESPEYYLKRGFVRYENNKTGACADWSKAGELGEYKAYDYIKDYCK